MRALIPIFALSFFLATSCASPLKSKIESAPTQSASQEQDVASQQRGGSYYDFNDIFIPKEMKLIPESSLLFETANFKAGGMFFEGRVDPVSLFDFFTSNMPKDGWQLRSYFKYGRYIMLFEKSDKDCIITIKDKALTTHLEMWVTPRLAK
ncbi:MAG: hypothetical protein ABII26_01145 [Pseudomonadota bacterium]